MSSSEIEDVEFLRDKSFEVVELLERNKGGSHTTQNKQKRKNLNY
jgi:hypothetical protein